MIQLPRRSNLHKVILNKTFLVWPKTLTWAVLFKTDVKLLFIVCTNGQHHGTRATFFLVCSIETDWNTLTETVMYWENMLSALNTERKRGNWV